jgi:enoyl-CoA hydratase
MDGVARLTLDRPRVVNALDRETVRSLRRALAEARADQQVRVVVVAGTGGNFSSGADLREIAALASEDEAYEWTQEPHALLYELEACPKPVIAAIEGWCVGGGQELALACDFRLAHRGARFGQVEVDIGSIASWGGTQRLARTVGVARAKELALRGRHLDAEEALRLGLVHEVTDDLDAAVERWGAELAAKPPAALAATKLSLNRALDGTLADNLDLDARAFAALAVGDELKEGVSRWRA